MVHKSQGQESRRALAILRLAEIASVAQVAKQVEAARSTLYRGAGWHALQDEAGLIPSKGGRPKSGVAHELMDRE